MSPLLVLASIAGLVSCIGVIIVIILLSKRKDGTNGVHQLQKQLDELHNSYTKLVGTAEAQVHMYQSLQEQMVAQIKENRIELLDGMIRYQQAVVEKTEKLTEDVGRKMELIRSDNEKRLEQMRQTVDEKLQSTLETRLGESFKLVSTQLDVVYKELGKMQTLADGVGQLEHVLTNVKNRGIWGELQAERILEDILTPDQYAKNVATKDGSADRVEFAIKLPGGSGEHIWLPIDAKFPREDFERLLSAQDKADVELAKSARDALQSRISNEAKTIQEKYIDPPHTTNFAILFLPVEGLYAEVLSIPGIVEKLQREYQVILAGPTTLAATLNSLQMGFRTLAIEQRSSEVWKILGAVKVEFGRFGDVLDKVKTKLSQATSNLDSASVRSRAIERKLRSVESLPAGVTNPLSDLRGWEEDVIADIESEVLTEED